MWPAASPLRPSDGAPMWSAGEGFVHSPGPYSSLVQRNTNDGCSTAVLLDSSAPTAETRLRELSGQLVDLRQQHRFGVLRCHSC